MYMVAGLGNPGKKYENTKHNMGFDVLEVLERRHGINPGGLDMKGQYSKGIIGGERVTLLRPMTFMNLSGEAISAYINYYKLDPESELVVIYDDISLEPGQIRVRKKGSAGGHNGIKNIIQQLGTDKFARIRVGIGEKPPKWDLADYVLSPFSKEDREKVDSGIADAADALEMILAGDIDKAMNTYNSKKAQPATEAEKA